MFQIKEKNKITAKFQSTKRVPINIIEDTKRFLSPEKFRDFRETAPGTMLVFQLHMRS